MQVPEPGPQGMRTLHEVRRGVAEEDLLIHLRSGDVFGDRSHARYALPPQALLCPRFSDLPQLG
jgi:hypothetical protein